MKLDITKKLDLEYLGENWKGCYLEFQLPSYGEIKELSNLESKNDAEKIEIALQTITGLFRGGKAISDGKEVDVTKEDLKDFPIDVLTKSFQLISGELSPKENGS